MQLRTGGDPDFVDLYAEVPWMEFKASPTARPVFFWLSEDTKKH